MRFFASGSYPSIDVTTRGRNKSGREGAQQDCRLFSRDRLRSKRRSHAENPHSQPTDRGVRECPAAKQLPTDAILSVRTGESRFLLTRGGADVAPDKPA